MTLRKTFSLFVLLFFTTFSFSQSINFKELSLNQSIEIAKKEKKQIFVYLQSNKPDLNQTFENETFEVSMNLQFTQDYLFNQKNISLRLPANNSDAVAVRKKANIPNGHLGLVWLNSEGEIHTSFDVSVLMDDHVSCKFAFILSLEKYIEMEFKNKIDSLAAEHKRGNRLTTFLKECVTTCGIHFNQYQFNYIKPPKIDYNEGDLLEQYIQSLSSEQRISSETIALITDMGSQAPLKYGGYAYEILKKNLNKFKNTGDSVKIKQAFKYAAQNQLTATKGTKKQKKILKDISEIFAGEGCNFVERINFISNSVNNSISESDTSTWETLVGWMIDYELKKLDKKTLLNSAILLRQNCYYYTQSKKINQYFNDPMAKLKKELDDWDAIDGPVPPEMGIAIDNADVLTVPGNKTIPINYFAEFLNNSAWRFYESRTTTKKMLASALKWSKVSLEIDKRDFNLDTYAHLLYRLGEKEKAIKSQKEAVEMCHNLNPNNCTEIEKGLKEISENK